MKWETRCLWGFVSNAVQFKSRIAAYIAHCGDTTTTTTIILITCEQAINLIYKTVRIWEHLGLSLRYVQFVYRRNGFCPLFGCVGVSVRAYVTYTNSISQCMCVCVGVLCSYAYTLLLHQCTLPYIICLSVCLSIYAAYSGSRVQWLGANLMQSQQSIRRIWNTACICGIPYSVHNRTHTHTRTTLYSVSQLCKVMIFNSVSVDEKYHVHVQPYRLYTMYLSVYAQIAPGNSR